MLRRLRLLQTKLSEVQNDDNVKEIEKKLLVFENKYEGETEALDNKFVSQIEALR